MDKKSFLLIWGLIQKYWYLPLWGAAFTLLYFTAEYDYLLFHSLAEFFGIAIAAAIFMLTWNARRYMKNNYFLFIGTSFVFVAILEALHTLQYEGLGILGAGANRATQLWLATRYLEATSFLAAPLFIRRNLKIGWPLASYLIITAGLMGSIFLWHNFPNAYTPGVGLTWFKIVSEYIISLMFLAAAAELIYYRKYFDRGVIRLLILSLLVAVTSELAFAEYVSVYGFVNRVGHLLNIVAFYLMYKAIIETGLTKPYNLLFLDLKQQQGHLETERNKLQKYLEVAGVMMLALDSRQRVLLINKKGLEILQRSEEEVLGRNWFDNFVPKREVKKRRAFFRKLVSDHVGMADSENCIVRKDGDERVISWHHTIMLDGKGKVISTLSSGEDITERKAAENALQESRRNYQKLFDNKLNGVAYCQLITDEAGKPADYLFLDVNDAFENYAGLKKDQLVGKKVSQLASDGFMPPFSALKLHGRVALSGDEARFELYHEHLGRWYSVYDYSPRRGYFISIFSDITERKELEERKDEFISIASHELKTPVATIKAFAQVLGKRLVKVGGREDAHFVTHINEQTDKLTGLIDDLLDVSRIEAGKLNLNVGEFKLSRLVDEVVANFKHTDADREITREGNFTGLVKGDAVRIEQVLVNLISNAIKYSPSEKQIIVNVGKQRGKALVSVRDFGSGISMEDQARIFERFYRTSLAQKNHRPGFGLGLYISSEIIRQHGGRIWVESRPGKGSTFFFSLPVPEKSDTAMETGKSPILA